MKKINEEEVVVANEVVEELEKRNEVSKVSGLKVSRRAFELNENAKQPRCL